MSRGEMITAFGQTMRLEDHLISQIERHIVVTETGIRELDDLGIILQAALLALGGRYSINPTELDHLPQPARITGHRYIADSKISRLNQLTGETHVFTSIQPIRAESEEQAREKLMAYWEKHGPSGSTHTILSYSIRLCLA